MKLEENAFDVCRNLQQVYDIEHWVQYRFLYGLSIFKAEGKL
jgi:hypothetical protein